MSEKKVLQFGALIIAVALILRLIANQWAPVEEPVKFGQVILFLQTGRVIRNPPTTEPSLAPPELPQEAPAIKAVFSESDQSLVELRNTSDKSADVSAALLEDLTWDLYETQPTVLIVHSHGSESYQKTEDYIESASYRTLNTDYNMISIGDQLAQELESAGIRVIHDRTMYDVPSYNDAYVQARTGIQAHLKENPSICLVLDLHRDAATDANGNQIGYTVSTAEGDSAKLMLVLGTNHDGWQDNLSLATKLHVQLEKKVPGICRPINVRAQRYNQDLCPGSVLVEVGATGNSRQEALLAAKLLANAIISLAVGT